MAEYILQLVLLFICMQSCQLEQFHTEQVGTVLFSDADNLRKCWPREKASLLTSRMMFQDILPSRTALNMADEQYNTAFIAYFRMMVDTVKKKTTGKSKDIMLQALTDALGGYLHHLALPLAKHAFYMGNISYESIRKLYDLYDELVAFLRTNGRYWFPPITNFAGMNHGAKLEVLPTSGDEKSDPCSGLLYTEHADGSIGIPMPFFDSKNLPSSIAVPFRAYSLRNLQSKNNAYVLVKYYTTSIACLKHKNAHKASTDKFNNDFEQFLEEEVMIHLNDEKLYPAFGSVYRVLITVNKATGHKSKYLNNLESGPPTTKDAGENKSKAQPGNMDSILEYLGDRKRRIILVPAIVFIACVWILIICLYCYCKYRNRRKQPQTKDVDTISNASTKKSKDGQKEQKKDDVETKSISSKKSNESIYKTAVANIQFSESSSSTPVEECTECEDVSKCVQIPRTTGPSATSTPKRSATATRQTPSKDVLTSKSTSKSAQSVPLRPGLSKTTTTSSTLSEKTDRPVVFGYDFETSSSDTDTTDDTSGRTTPI